MARPGRVWLGALFLFLLLVLSFVTPSAAQEDTGQARWLLAPDAPDITIAVEMLSAGRLCFVDSDASGGYAAGEPVLLDVTGSCGGSVSGQDLRLNAWGDQAGGQRVLGGPERGATLSSLDDARIRFLDANGNGWMDEGDTVYVDAHAPTAAVVGVGDVRLSPFDDHPAFSIVRGGDEDLGRNLVLLGAVSDRVGYVDADGDRTLDPDELLYLRADLRLDRLVAYGDLRLTRVDAARPAGSFVTVGDGDGAFRLKDWATPVCYLDQDASGTYGSGEALYIDLEGACGGDVAVGDVRLSASAHGPAGSRVAAGDEDVDLDLDPLLDRLVAYVDADRDARATLGDSFYLMVGGDETTVGDGDLRISPYVGRGGAFVGAADADHGATVRSLGTFEEAIGFSDSTGGARPSLHDPLYLNVDLGGTEGVEAGDVRLVGGRLPFGGSASLASGEVLTPVRSASAVACFALESSSYSAGDAAYFVLSGSCTSVQPGAVRLTPTGGHDAGTVVRSGDGDEGVDLDALSDAAELRFYDRDGNGRWSLEDTLYLDIRDQNGFRVNIGDLRLSRFDGESGPVVRSGEHDLDAPLVHLGTVGSRIHYIDLDSDLAFGPGDVAYVNVDAIGTYTTLLDVRLVRLVDVPAPFVPPDANGEPGPSEPAEPSGPPTDPTDPTEPAQPTEPSDPTEPAEPTEPGGNGSEDDEPRPRVRTPGPVAVLTLLALLVVVAGARRD